MFSSLMDKYLVPISSSTLQSAGKSRRVKRWRRNEVELTGRSCASYRHSFSGLIIQSYSEAGELPHSYHVDGEPCRTHVDIFTGGALYSNTSATTRQGVSALEFDSKGVYLASVTKSGCLTVHDFDNIQRPEHKEDESKQLMHISTGKQLDVIRWNLANQDEVACTSTKSSEIQVFDIGYVSTDPIVVLRKRPNVTVHGFNVPKGFSDIAFLSDDKSRLLASDCNGSVNMWDRRMGGLPCLQFRTTSAGSLNSIKLNNEIIYGASKQGTISLWDLRGGRASTAFRNHKEEYYNPCMTLKLAQELEKISTLKAQSNIVPKEIHSIDIDPSCPFQLAFHLDDGWSGVLDTNKFEVTHIHCPPPPWLDEHVDISSLSYLKKPCWLPINSIYAVGSSSSNGLYLLDFFPDRTSPCHVDYIEDTENIDEANKQNTQNKYLALSAAVTSCAAHPLNGTIVVGTKFSSLLVISQEKVAC